MNIRHSTYLSLSFVCIMLFLPRAVSAQESNIENMIKEADILYNMAVSKYEEDTAVFIQAYNLYYSQYEPYKQICQPFDFSNYLLNMAVCLTVSDAASVKILDYCNEALSTTMTSFGENSQEYSYIMARVGTICQELGDRRRSMKLVSEALRISKKDRRSNIYLYSDVVKMFSDVMSDNDFGEIAKRETKKKDEFIGTLHINNSLSLSKIYLSSANTYFNTYHSGRGLKAYSSSFDGFSLNIKNNFSVMSEAERERFWYNNNGYFNGAIRLLDLYYGHSFLSDDWLLTAANTLFPSDKQLPAAAYNSALLSKGLLLKSSTEFIKMLQEKKDSSLINTYESLEVLRQKSESSQDPEMKARLADTISIREKDILNIAKESGYHDFTEHISVKWDDVQSSLPSDEDIAIEFYNTGSNYGALLIKKGWKGPRVFKIRKKGRELEDILLLSKKESKHIGNRYLNVQSAIESNDITIKQYLCNSSRLGKAIFGKIKKYLPAPGSGGNIYFSPSGLLNFISIENLPAYSSNIDDSEPIVRYSDLYNIYRLSSTKNLYSRQSDKERNAASLFGAVDYSRISAGRSPLFTRDTLFEDILRTIGPDSANSNESRGAVSLLPATLLEVVDIKKQLDTFNVSCIVYTGSYASEKSFRENSNESIVHIATHGFYFPVNDIDNALFLKKIIKDEPTVIASSLYRTGLLLAGASKTISASSIHYQEGSDGILTSKEISMLDLNNVDLVVLSACKTARGDFDSEGVFGLQRAFKKAGVNTIIMSLWEVDDVAAKEMMVRFYSYYLKNGDKHEAFKKAQQELRDSKKYHNPYYWSSFILLDPEI